MMLLHDFLREYTLLENTHDLFVYRDFALRLETRFGKRLLRDDYTPNEIQNVAQNTFDVHLDFFATISRSVINPFETWNESGEKTLGTSFTSTTTPDLTDTTTPNLTDTTTPNLTDTTTHDGTVKDEGQNSTSGSQDNFVNAYDSTETSTPRDNSTSTNTGSGSNTTTYDNSDTTTHSGTTTLSRTGTTSTTHTGNTKIEHKNNGTDTYHKSGFSVDDYIKAMNSYYAFIDVVIDFIVRDILFITIRKGDI